jgi:hypothetical protein
LTFRIFLIICCAASAVAAIAGHVSSFEEVFWYCSAVFSVCVAVLVVMAIVKNPREVLFGLLDADSGGSDITPSEASKDELKREERYPARAHSKLPEDH